MNTRILLVMQLVINLAVSGCGGKQEKKAEITDRTGTLVFTANGEDFVRRGFVSGDGWRIALDTVLISLANPKAYQLKSSDVREQVARGILPEVSAAALSGNFIVDLAAGDTAALPIEVGRVKKAPAGVYNGLRLRLVKMKEGPYAGAVMVLKGRADKEGALPIDFTLALDHEITATCGGYVGEHVKGTVKPGGLGEVEMTFHIDHLFGDGTRPPEDHVNTNALGFGWIAARAENNVVRLSPSQAMEALGEKGRTTFSQVVRSLPHSGEGHCHCEQ
ncbi:MAG: DUF4382 domain-containing protein [Chitinivibrionales bacterium]|nr:DUF4382 domain-containing protein [Chitinivibrionales bacterium]MBD3356369.1 DUF4382 domain-containing protein [Chitinivibrionales bacterium]